MGCGLTVNNVIRDHYKSFAELQQGLRESNVESMKLVIGFDFSKSNEWTGEKSYGKHLHGVDYLNPYLHALQVLEPVVKHFDDDLIIPSFRFGCVDTRNSTVLPLLYPHREDPHFQGFDELKKAYYEAIKFVKLSGPTSFNPIIQQAIEIHKAYQSKQLIFLLILTDGDVDSVKLDKKSIFEAASYPISICVLGLGDGPFDKMEEFDDMKGRIFDNFQFVNFTELEKNVAKMECPDLELATHVFQELPLQVLQMRKAGLL
ncbi:Copine_I [Hexamita inflata]|uniref:Copine I n=1 Tax=Hexamita inflata TaxID=28002 RepID=A0AA86P5E6_9EUKA|nr:Copine I [Hexamita inflata]